MNKTLKQDERTGSRSSRARTIKLCLTALFAALISSGAFVSIPLPGGVPFTIQNLFAVLAGLLLGPIWGAASVALYLGAGAVGIPVFAGASGGLAQFLSPSGGYLYGYCLGAAIAGLILGFPGAGRHESLARIAAAAIVGFVIVYVPGVFQLKILLHADWKTAFVVGFVPFAAGDAVKILIVVPLAKKLRRVIANLNE
jgi:biotin transport system substrate-specific component